MDRCVTYPDQSQIAEGVIHRDADGSLLLRPSRDIGHPGIRDLETAIGARQHKEQCKVQSTSVRCRQRDDDSSHGNKRWVQDMG